LEGENMLLRARLEDYPNAEPDEKKRMELMFKRRQIGLIKAKLQYEDEQKELAKKKQLNRSEIGDENRDKAELIEVENGYMEVENDVTCDCGECGEEEEEEDNTCCRSINLEDQESKELMNKALRRSGVEPYSSTRPLRCILIKDGPESSSGYDELDT